MHWLSDYTYHLFVLIYWQQTLTMSELVFARADSQCPNVDPAPPNYVCPDLEIHSKLAVARHITSTTIFLASSCCHSCPILHIMEYQCHVIVLVHAIPIDSMMLLLLLSMVTLCTTCGSIHFAPQPSSMHIPIGPGPEDNLFMQLSLHQFLEMQYPLSSRWQPFWFFLFFLSFYCQAQHFLSCTPKILYWVFSALLYGCYCCYCSYLTLDLHDSTMHERPQENCRYRGPNYHYSQQQVPLPSLSSDIFLQP